MNKSRVKKFLQRGLLAAGTLALLGGLLLFWLEGHCNRRERALNEAWGRVQIPLDKIPEHFPPVQDNDAALALEERGAALGIAMVPPPGSRHPPTAAALSEFKALKESKGDIPGLSDFLMIQMEKPGPEVDPLPEHFRRYLKTHTADLAALREQVRRAPPPRWGYDLQRDGIEIRIPNVLGILMVEKVLILDAFDRLAERDESTAEADLETAWKISAGLESNPTLVGQLILIASRLMNLSALRKFRAPAAEWEARLSGYDPRGKIALAMEAEIWMQQHTIATRSGTQLKASLSGNGLADEKKPGLIRFIPASLLRRMMRLSSLNVSDLEQRRLDALQRLDPCESPAALLGARNDLRLPWWDFIGGILSGNNERSWNRANRATLHIESARKLLALKSARQKSRTGRWPASLEGLQSSVCSDGKWTYFTYEDGTLSLSFNKPFQNQPMQFDEGIKGANYPLSYREEPAAVTEKISP